MAGKLLAGVAKDIDLVATGGKLAEKMDDKKKADDGGSFWDDALDTPPLEGEAFESAVLALTKNNGAAVDPEEREKVIPTPSRVLGRISPIFPPFCPSFARFHRLAEEAPTSRKPEPRVKRQSQGGPNTVSPA